METQPVIHEEASNENALSSRQESRHVSKGQSIFPIDNVNFDWKLHTLNN